MRIFTRFRALDTPSRLLAVTAAAGVLGGIFLRGYALAYPAKQVFDEVYFPVFAAKYLQRMDVFDVHPPLGKFLIAIGIAAFGDVPFGWRIIPLLFGLALIPLISYLAFRLSGSRAAGLLAALFVSVDGALIAYSRTGLMDGLLCFAMLGCLGLALRMRTHGGTLLLMTAVGLTAAIKWVGLAVLVPTLYLAWRGRRLPGVLTALGWSAAAYLGVVTAGQALGGAAHPLQAALDWHVQAANYHLRLTDPHPWSSVWWSWPLLQRPVLFLYDVFPDGRLGVMTTLGNPAAWWASSLAVLGSAGWVLNRWVRRLPVAEHPVLLLLLAWGAAYLPWAWVTRTVFLYHYLPAYCFALLLLAYWCSQFRRTSAWAVASFAVAVLAAGIWFAPLAVGWWGLQPVWLARHVWVTRWLY